MKKVKLSDIAINAAKLDGKNASYYDHVATGWNSLLPNNRINITNVKDPDRNTGLYFSISSAEGRPLGSSSGYLFVMKVRVGLLAQIFIPYNNPGNIYVITYNDGTWSEWKEL